MKKLSLSEYKKRVKTSSNGRLKVLSTAYVNLRTKLNHLCTECETAWFATPSNILNTLEVRSLLACPTCGIKDRNEQLRISTEEVLERLDSKFSGRIKLVGQYRGKLTDRYRFKCYDCLHTWKNTMKRVLGTKFGCSVCARQKTEYVPPKTTGKRFKYKDYTQGDVTVKVQGYEPQALDWIFNKFPSLILNKSLFVETSGKVPVVKYKVGNRNRTYFPDMYLPKQKRIIEVKSPYTLGALTGRRWKKTQSKAQACIDQGYKFTLLLMNAKGERLWIPKDWYALSRKDVLAQVAYHYGDHMKDE